MMNPNNLENSTKSFRTIQSLIENGDIKIPQFQREFVWKVDDSARLIDSILKNYPIGNFIFWRTDQQLRSIRDIGNMVFPIKSEGERVDYILDGQQRITSLYASFKGLEIKDKKKIKDFRKIWIDLDSTYDDRIVVTDPNRPNKISLIDLINHKWDVGVDYIDKVRTYYESLIGFQFPITSILNSPTSVATDIFTRLNVGGKKLGPFEIMCASTYDGDLGFDLQEKFEELNRDLKESNYSISDSQVLQLVSILLTHREGVLGGCTNKFILNLNKSDFIGIWQEAVISIKSAVDYMRLNLCPTDRLLPYPPTLVLFAYFFNKNKLKVMTTDQKMYLDDLFWRISMGGRYSSSLESKLMQDILKVDKIVNHVLPQYEWTVDIDVDYIINNGEFNKNSSFTKAWICLLSLLGPRSFKNNSLVVVDGNWQLSKNSPNLHHFFPRRYLSRVGCLDSPDHILNMTIIDDSLNKSISDKEPSLYIKKLSDDNSLLIETLRTHLIGGFDRFGILENDYIKFKRERARLFSNEFNKRIIFQMTGNEPQDIEEFIDDELVDQD